MKVVILAGGFGTRISEESKYRPKPMVELGSMPILLHIMKHYSAYGYNDFVICAGYKQNTIKEYFAHYFLNRSDVTFDFSKGKNDIILHQTPSEPWKVTVADTGLYTMTGGRIRRIRDYLEDEPFMLTYGDGVSNVDLRALEAFHCQHGKMVTISVHSIGSRFGVLDVHDDGSVKDFREKAEDTSSNLVNIGYMVCQPELIDLIAGDEVMLEGEPLKTVAQMDQLVAYKHTGFWQCMDTTRDKELLEQLWRNGTAPWKVW